MFDSNDRRILSLLQSNGRMPLSDVAKETGIATSTVHERLRRLQDKGVISGFSAQLNPNACGLHTLAFIQILVVGAEHELPFIEHVQGLPEVVEFYDLTGEWSFLLKVWTQSIEDLSNWRRVNINPAPGVTRTNTTIALTTYKSLTALPLDLGSE